MMHLDEKNNQQEHALAQLLVHAPRNSSSKNYGEEASTEDLAMLAEGTLEAARREQVLNQLNDNATLYETWMMLQEFAQCDSVQERSQERSQEQLQEAAPKQSAHVRKQPSLIEKITDWFSELFSWQGAFATSFGVALGAVFMMQAGIDSESGYDSDLRGGIAIHAPIEAPQKANIDIIQNAPIQIDSDQISRVDILKIENVTVHFRITLKSGEVIEDSYVLNLNQDDVETM